MGENWGALQLLGPGYSAFWVPVFGFRIERREATKGRCLLRSATRAHLIHIVLAVGLRAGVGATTVQLPSLANRERSLIALLLDVDAPAGEACLLLDTCGFNELHVENRQPGVPLRAQHNAVCSRDLGTYLVLQTSACRGSWCTRRSPRPGTRCTPRIAWSVSCSSSCPRTARPCFWWRQEGGSLPAPACGSGQPKTGHTPRTPQLATGLHPPRLDLDLWQPAF